ncbi:MAG: argininosuccinate lyase [Solirubrobacteraceae bacterium]
MSRLSQPQHPGFRRLNTSLQFDRRLWPQDLAGSRAPARMLAARDLISAQDAEALLGGLDAIEAELREERFPFEDGDEDIHMAIERRLIDLLGPVGGKLHTARSRNDQVITDLALYLGERCQVAHDAVLSLMGTLLARAREHLDWPMPGYTHLQRAQPVYLSHHLLAYFWMLDRDAVRFEHARQAAGIMPLGSGALAGVGFDTDRMMVAGELGFHGVSANSLDAVSGRDFVLDYLGAAATCATHLSRLGAELVLWSSEELGFCELPDAWTSTSSIMPQKKNPDAAELLRAKAPRIVAHLAALHGVLHALPLAYNKDLQEDKEHVFDTADTIELSLEAARGMLEGVRFHREVLARAASGEAIAATELADLLVRRGVPFREAHGVVADLVRSAMDSGRELSGLRREELAEAHAALASDCEEVYELLRSPGDWIESKVSQGGTARVRVEEQLAGAQEVLDRRSAS